MAIFSRVDVMGPAHRQNQVQAFAQKAAQNVMRRQRLRKLIQSGAAAAGAAAGGASGGVGQPFRGSMVHRATGMRGRIQRTGLTPETLKSMLQGAGTPGFIPVPGAVNPSGGGYDFSSIPDPTDPHQSPASLPSNYTTPKYLGNGQWIGGDGQQFSSFNPDGSYIGDEAFSAHFPEDNPDSLGAMDSEPLPNNGFLIPLGGGMFYDPTTDSVLPGGNARTPGSHIE